MSKGILMTVRLLWLVSLVTGLLFYFHAVSLPINTHMYIGFAIALLLLVLGLIGFRAVAGLAIGTISFAILLPVIGILQLTHIGRPDLPYIQITHVLVALGSMGVAEVLGKRLRLKAA